MNAKNATMIGLAVLGVLAGNAKSVLAQSSTGYLNVSGTIAGVGKEIKIELKNANGVVVGSSSFTPSNGDTAQRVSKRLNENFSGAGFGSKKLKDKADGADVIKFYRKRSGGQNFDINIITDEGSITLNTKAFSGLSGSTSMVNSDIDISLGQAELVITGEGFLSSLYAINGVDFGDNVITEGYQILDNFSLRVNIAWDPGMVALGSEPVFIDGFDYTDLENTNDQVSLWIVDSFTFTPAPGPAVLAGLAGFTALRRRHRS